MKYSLVVANLLYKIDINDYFGLALNQTIGKIIIDNINKGSKWN